MIDAQGSRYETLGRIGSGGMATVSVGRVRGAAGFSRLVALKRSHTRPNDAESAVTLEREARVAACLHHPNIVGVLDVEQDGDDFVLVLEYVEGCTLAELLTRVPPRSQDRVMLRVLLDAAAGLDAAHRATDEEGRPHAIVHRDVTPSNVLVGTDGTSRLSDFGIAKANAPRGAALSERTATGVLKGKCAYMAPEYIEHQRATPAGDLFALGVIVWEALAGKRLFRGATEIETLRRAASAHVPSLASLRPELESLDAVVARALARHAEDRYPSVDAFASALEAEARALDLVASHAEVAALVEIVAADQLAKRRAVLRNADESTASVVGRDEAATATTEAPPTTATIVLPPKSAGALSFVFAVFGLGAIVGLVFVMGQLHAVHPAAPVAVSDVTLDPPVALAEPATPPALVAPVAQPGAASVAMPVVIADEPAVAMAPRPRARARIVAPRRATPAHADLAPKKAPPNPYVL